jgi:hypothetical protein
MIKGNSNVSLKDYMMDLAQKTGVLNVFYGPNVLLSSLQGRFEAYPLEIFTDGQIRRVIPIGRYVIDSGRFVAWEAERLLYGDSSAFYLQQKASSKEEMVDKLSGLVPKGLEIKYKRAY